MKKIQFLLLPVFLTILFTLFHTTGKANNIDDRTNLALRQTAHFLLIENGDSTSQIPPVIQNDNSYSIEIPAFESYESLPDILDKALKDFDVDKKYLVKIRECDSDTLILGFHNVALIQGVDVPCQKREMVAQCSVITLEFLEEKENTLGISPWYLLFVLPVALILGLTLRSPKDRGSVALKEPVEKPLTKLGSTSFDFKNQVVSINNLEKTLTYRENKLMKLFVAHPNEVLERDKIMAEVWEDEGVVVGRSLDVFVSRLRKIIKEDKSIQIKSVHGVGYRLEVD